jgi:hypothetical protein
MDKDMPIIYLLVNMLGKLTLCFLLAVMVVSVSVPCTQYQSSKNGNASDCSINRLDTTSISWGARINFNVAFKWTDKSFSNVLADMSSPKLPISPSKTSCTTKPAAYNKGDSVIVNCTQAFSSIPVGYANVVTAFDGDDYPLGFSMKIPLSMPNLLK